MNGQHLLQSQHIPGMKLRKHIIFNMDYSLVGAWGTLLVTASIVVECCRMSMGTSPFDQVTPVISYESIMLAPRPNCIVKSARFVVRTYGTYVIGTFPNARSSRTHCSS